MSFDPFRTAGSNLIGDPDAIQVPIIIDFETRDFLTTRMFDRLIDAMNSLKRCAIVQAAMQVGIYGIEFCAAHIHLANRSKLCLWPNVDE